MEYGQILSTSELDERIAELESDAEELDVDESSELAELYAAAEAGIADWQYGETLIREDYFQEYAQELAEDCGFVPDDLAWPLTCIDWEQAADELRTDYTQIELQGYTYLVRA